MFDYRIERMLNSVNWRGEPPKILIWSACEKSDYELEALKKAGIDIYGYIDRDYEKIKQYNGYNVYSRDIIKSEKFFVYIALEGTYSDILSFLHENNYKEYEDFWYPCREVHINGDQPYSDLYGNEYFGYGYNNVLIVLNDGGKCSLERNLSFGEDVKIYAEINSSVNIEDNCRISSYVIVAAKCNSKISIGNGSTIERRTEFYSEQNSRITVGSDCMISVNIIFRAGNSHNLFDMEHKQSITGGKINTVTLSEHVWVGQRAVIFSGADIGSGSVVGINSFVNKKFPNNCSIAGNPARIIKNNIAWRREIFPYFDEYDDFAEFDYRDKNTEEADNY